MTNRSGRAIPNTRIEFDVEFGGFAACLGKANQVY